LLGFMRNELAALAAPEAKGDFAAEAAARAFLVGLRPIIVYPTSLCGPVQADFDLGRRR
jgi:hypothetical protein